MDTVVPGLYATAPQPLAFASSKGVRTFLLARDGNNLLVYNSDTIVQGAAQVHEKGGVRRRYAGHGQKRGLPRRLLVGRERFWRLPGHSRGREGSDLLGPRGGRDVQAKAPRRGRFRGSIDPGSHEGGVGLSLGQRGAPDLFTGGTVKLECGEWVAVLLDPDARDDYLRSLELTRRLDFDVLAPWTASSDKSFYAFIGGGDTLRRVDGILGLMRRG